LIRQELGVERWSVLGQSFGGFCSMTYLSIAPDGLAEALITGGLSPIGRPVDQIYSATYRRAMQKNREYFGRYPEEPTTSAGPIRPTWKRRRPIDEWRPAYGTPLPPARWLVGRQRWLGAAAPRPRAAFRLERLPG
jgi:pimeloyl-ACP methyl ester carboxylesterase